MFSFVILHYKTIDETLKCLKSIKNTFSHKDISMIVVDNHTLNSEDTKRIEEYTNDIILLEENLGFAKANNIGIKYALEKYNPDFIAVINNDVYITQKEFIKYIKEDFTKYQFDMLGPWIDSRTSESCNPFPIIGTKDNVIKYINRTKKLIKIYSNSILYLLFNICMRIKHRLKKPKVPMNGIDLKTNIGLHGCSIIFSKKYLQKYKYPFYNDTFLFHEEEFLYNRVIKDNLVSLYDPRLRVYHAEGSSMRLNKINRLNRLFKEKEKLKSLELLLKNI